MIPLKNTFIEDISIEVEGIVKDFFFYEDANPSEKNHSKIVEFHEILQKILSEAIDEIFHQGLSTILQLKKDIKYLTEQIEIKQKEISQEIKVFMPILQKLDSNLTDINPTDLEILRDPFQRSILELAISKKNCQKEHKEERKDIKIEHGISFFKYRPRSANILFMEKRMREIYNGEIVENKVKEHLKPLLNEWKDLNPEIKKEYEQEAENELLLTYIQ